MPENLQKAALGTKPRGEEGGKSFVPQFLMKEAHYLALQKLELLIKKIIKSLGAAPIKYCLFLKYRS